MSHWGSAKAQLYYESAGTLNEKLEALTAYLRVPAGLISSSPSMTQKKSVRACSQKSARKQVWNRRTSKAKLPRSLRKRCGNLRTWIARRGCPMVRGTFERIQNQIRKASKHNHRRRQNAKNRRLRPRNA